MSYQTKRVRSKSVRDSIFTEDGWKCAYCLRDLSRDVATDRERTVDHVIPRSFGGNNARINLLMACANCNSRRGNRSVIEFVGAETLVRLVRDYPRVAGTLMEDAKRAAREARRVGTAARSAQRRLKAV